MSRKTAAETAILAGMFVFFISGVLAALLSDRDIISIITLASVAGAIVFFGLLTALLSFIVTEKAPREPESESIRAKKKPGNPDAARTADLRERGDFVESAGFPKVSEKHKGKAIDITVKGGEEDLYRELFSRKGRG